MKKVLYSIGAALAGILLQPGGVCADAAPAAAGGTNWVAISAAFGMALAAFGGAWPSRAWLHPRAKVWHAIQAHRELFAQR